ncbi:hypothetical protein [Campylobacter concisus]|uniref:hypothetical protein n=1 Tax=Campylobacter concisus TaxID=199 RepID=UPI000CD89FCC|nr:hypothetical protein [Campylobacter concisus]
MVTIEELKLGNKTLEALKFLLLQINELDVILNELNFEELREANNQAKTQIEVLNNIKTVVLNTEKSIEQVKASIDSRSEEINTTKREIEDAKTNIIKAKDDTILIYENISSKSERIEQKYNEIGEIKKGVDRKFDDIKTIEEQSRDMANEITNNKNIILKKIDENINTLNNTISKINILKNETLQEIATTKAGIDTKANEALNTATSSLNEIKTILNDFKGKQTELNALKASLETLKSSLENLNKSGLINDTQAGIAQTYSSNKINNLLQGVLRESDAAESNANGKLVKRNAQGNIYATNIYLNATTKAEVSDIKNSLSTDKWRFIVRDTEEGLLRSMSIKDFMSSQLADMNTALGSKVDYSKANQPNGYPQLDANSRISTAQLPTEINATTLNGQPDTYYASSRYVANIEQSLRTLIGQTAGRIDNKLDTSKVMEGNTGVIKTSALPDTLVYVSPSTREIPLSVMPLKDTMSRVNGSNLNLNNEWSKHYVMNFTTRNTFQIYGLDKHIGQTGVIVMKGAKNITGWGSNMVWREVPTDLKDTEVFAYFVASATEVYMGRA